MVGVPWGKSFVAYTPWIASVIVADFLAFRFPFMIRLAILIVGFVIAITLTLAWVPLEAR